MEPFATDRNLLFGILALQMDFISRDALISAINAWALEKYKPLGRSSKSRAHSRRRIALCSSRWCNGISNSTAMTRRKAWPRSARSIGFVGRSNPWARFIPRSFRVCNGSVRPSQRPRPSPVRKRPPRKRPARRVRGSGS